MVMAELLGVHLRGRMSSGALDGFRRALKLEKRGRLADQEDADFGYRYLREDPENLARLTLWRLREDYWKVALTHLAEPIPAEVVEKIRVDTLAVAERFGFEVDKVVPSSN